MEFSHNQVFNLFRRGCENVGQARNRSVDGGWRRVCSTIWCIGLALLSQNQGEVEIKVVVIR